MRRRRFSRHGSINLPAEERFQFEPRDVWLSRHTKKPLKDQVVSIKCLNKIHRIQFRFPGRITLCNHPDLKGELLMMKLGGDKPECLIFMEHWRKNPMQVAQGRPLVQKFMQAREDWKKARAGVRESYKDWLLNPIKDRLQARVTKIYKHLQAAVSRQWENQERDYPGYNYRYHSSYLEAPDQMIQARVKLVFKELITKEEDIDETSD